MSDRRVTVLASGRGTNAQALLDAMRAGKLQGSITQIVTNRPDAPVLGLARAYGVPIAVVDHQQYQDRAEFDAALAQAIDAHDPALVVLAGFMRVLGDTFVNRYAGRLINVHPSLLPLYPGLHTHRRALADGVRIHGCTVHFVTPDVDVGPIIAQGAVAVEDGDTEATLSARVLAVEHQLLPLAVRWFVTGALKIEGRRVTVRHADHVAPPALLAPRSV